jgi:tetratricopeptide (TPR) repeat protein
MSAMSEDDIQKYEQMLSDDPESRAFAPLAEAYRKANRLEDAIRTARSGLEVHPGYSGGLLVLGRALYETRELDPAAEVLKKAVADSPENYLGQKFLGKVLKDKGDLKGALRALEAANFLSPEDEEVAGILEELKKKADPPKKMEFEAGSGRESEESQIVTYDQKPTTVDGIELDPIPVSEAFSFTPDGQDVTTDPVAIRSPVQAAPASEPASEPAPEATPTPAPEAVDEDEMAVIEISADEFDDELNGIDDGIEDVAGVVQVDDVDDIDAFDPEIAAFIEEGESLAEADVPVEAEPVSAPTIPIVVEPAVEPALEPLPGPVTEAVPEPAPELEPLPEIMPPTGPATGPEPAAIQVPTEEAPVFEPPPAVEPAVEPVPFAEPMDVSQPALVVAAPESPGLGVAPPPAPEVHFEIPIAPTQPEAAPVVPTQPETLSFESPAPTTIPAPEPALDLDLGLDAPEEALPETMGFQPADPSSLDASATGGSISTETLADLYAQQGLTDKALEIYRQILQERPEEEVIGLKIMALEGEMDQPGSQPSTVQPEVVPAPVDLPEPPGLPDLVPADLVPADLVPADPVPAVPAPDIPPALEPLTSAPPVAPDALEPAAAQEAPAENLDNLLDNLEVADTQAAGENDVSETLGKWLENAERIKQK